MGQKAAAAALLLALASGVRAEAGPLEGLVAACAGRFELESVVKDPDLSDALLGLAHPARVSSYFLCRALAARDTAPCEELAPVTEKGVLHRAPRALTTACRDTYAQIMTDRAAIEKRPEAPALCKAEYRLFYSDKDCAPFDLFCDVLLEAPETWTESCRRAVKLKSDWSKDPAGHERGCERTLRMKLGLSSDCSKMEDEWQVEECKIANGLRRAGGKAKACGEDAAGCRALLSGKAKECRPFADAARAEICANLDCAIKGTCAKEPWPGLARLAAEYNRDRRNRGNRP